MQSFISDLALILISAGVVSIVFKRLKQPVVLGYIVAGFLTGPHMPYTPSVMDMSGLHTWADVGVVFLMFALGLEFSFKKIVKMGARPIIAACCVMFCMMSLGSAVGRLFDWGTMNSLFLGGMLAMSSTTIIYKAFDDLGLRQQKFAGEVLSVLILEDILGILLMVVLSALAVSRQFEGAALAVSLLQLGFFLILCFVVGVYLVPLFFKRARAHLNNETLLVVSIGLCALLVVLADKAGYSSAFGAFMMGSILAETVEAERIDRLVGPVKDLFGAIFFVSVGMLVDPAVLVEYWLPILVLCAAIIVGQATLGSASFLLSGQPLRTAIQGGFSLAQIGEFAFIIASLGMTLGVTDRFLYPVVVAVSIITTFFTPYMIKAARPAADMVERIVPDDFLRRFDGHRQRAQRETKPRGGLWHKLLSALINQVGVYFSLSIAVILLSFSFLLPLCRGVFGHWPGNAVCGLLTLATASPFLRAIVMRKNHSDEWKKIRRRGRISRALLGLTFFARYALAAAAIYYVLNYLSPFWWPWHVLASVVLLLPILASRLVKWVSIKMERTFLQNLRQREVKAKREKSGGRPGYAGRLNSRNIHIARMEVPGDTTWGGKRLDELNFSRSHGVMIAAIVRAGRRLNIPSGKTILFPGDILEVIGDDHGLDAFARRIGREQSPPSRLEGDLLLRRLIIREDSLLIGLSLPRSGIRERYRCSVVGFENGEGEIVPARADHVIERGDMMWIVGEDESLRRLMGV